MDERVHAFAQYAIRRFNIQDDHSNINAAANYLSEKADELTEEYERRNDEHADALEELSKALGSDVVLDTELLDDSRCLQEAALYLATAHNENMAKRRHELSKRISEDEIGKLEERLREQISKEFGGRG